MSLPLPYRPPRVVECLEEEKKESLKMTINKKDLFMSGMFGWYQRLPKRKKAVLTKKQVEYRAQTQAYQVKLPYKQIPEDYMQRMVRECGLVCYISKAAKAVSPLIKSRRFPMYFVTYHCEIAETTSPC
jgi:hypothetical protein